MNINGEVAEFVADIALAGWKVEQSRRSNAWKVVMAPCGREGCNHTLTIHSTPGHGRWRRDYEPQLKAHGFAAAKRNARARQARQAKTRAVAERVQAEAKIAKIDARNARRITSGPASLILDGDPVPVDFDWFFSDKPKVAWALVTPEVAQKLLDECNIDNRPMTSKGHKSSLAGQMQRDKFQLTHQGIAVNSNGELTDGQYRLTACAEAGKPIAVPVFAGMPPENFSVVDTGLKKTAAQLIGRKGAAAGHPPTLQSGIRLLLAYEGGIRNPKDAIYKGLIANDDIIARLDSEPERFAELSRWAQGTRNSMYLASGPLLAGRYLVEATNGQDNRHVQRFFASFREELPLGDARQRLRRRGIEARASGHRIDGSDVVAMVVSAWNFCAAGHVNPRYFTIPEELPRVTVLLADTPPPSTLL